MEEQLKEQANLIIKQIINLSAKAVIDKQTNEQWFINFLDDLNKLSVNF